MSVIGSLLGSLAKWFLSRLAWFSGGAVWQAHRSSKKSLKGLERVKNARDDLRRDPDARKRLRDRFR